VCLVICLAAATDQTPVQPCHGSGETQVTTAATGYRHNSNSLRKLLWRGSLMQEYCCAGWQRAWHLAAARAASVLSRLHASAAAAAASADTTLLKKSTSGAAPTCPHNKQRSTIAACSESFIKTLSTIHSRQLSCPQVEHPGRSFSPIHSGNCRLRSTRCCRVSSMRTGRWL